MHVPNWDGQPKASYQPNIVSDGKFFWVIVDHTSADEAGDDDPMKYLSGLCDYCAVQPLDHGEYNDHKHCPNCSANYTLSQFGGYNDESDRRLRVYLAQKITSAFEVMMSNVNKASFPKSRRTQSRQRDRSKKAPSVEVPDRVISRYPEEIKVLDRCAELQGDHWTILGTRTIDLGPEDHNTIVTEILPQLDDMDPGNNKFSIDGIPEAQRRLYLDLNYHFPVGSFRIAPKDGTRYWHPEYDDEYRLFRFPKDARPEYPEKESAKYRVGTQLNKILRHYIGQVGQKQTNWAPIKCNEGGWVLLDDVLALDYLWKDGRGYRWEQENNRERFLITRRERIGLIVELTVAECCLKGKTRFQLLGIVANNQEELDTIRKQYSIPNPQVETSPFGEAYGGWVMPIAIRASSGHSKDIEVPLEPTKIFKRLDLKTAIELKGAYHVTSPSRLGSIL